MESFWGGLVETQICEACIELKSLEFLLDGFLDKSRLLGEKSRSICRYLRY